MVTNDEGRAAREAKLEYLHDTLATTVEALVSAEDWVRAPGPRAEARTRRHRVDRERHRHGSGRDRCGSGRNQGGRGQKGQQAHSAGGGADALIGAGQGFGVARSDGDRAFQHFGGRAVGVIVEGDAEVGAAHGRDGDRGADGEAAGAAPGRDARLGAARLDRQGVIDGAVDGVAAQAADAHAAV